MRMHAVWYLQSLRSSGLAEATIGVYLGALLEFEKFAVANDLPREVSRIEHAHVQAFMLDQLTRLSRASAAARFGGLRSFFAWGLANGVIEASPMATMKAPTIPETPVPVLTDDQVKALLRACEGKAFKQRRDMALIRFMLDTGARRSEVAAVRVAEIDLNTGTVTFSKTKGSRPRLVAFGAKTASAIYAYLIERDRSRHASSPFLWVGQTGGLSGEAVGAIVTRRSRIAGVNNLDSEGRAHPIHAHQTRHTFADRYLAAGGSEGNLMALGGWRSREVMGRYGRSRAVERALDEARRIAVGDRL
jgi:integrase